MARRAGGGDLEPPGPVAERASMTGDPFATFIVRLSRDDAGHLSGVVEQVRTGVKRRVEGVEAITRVIAEMTADDAPTET